MGDEVQASWDTWGPQTSNPMPGQKTHSGRKRICSEEMLAQVQKKVPRTGPNKVHNAQGDGKRPQEVPLSYQHSPKLL